MDERFWAKVDKRDDGCWIWTRATNNGYGVYRVMDPMPKGTLVRAHRYAYEQLVGPIPAGLQLDHLCRVRACVNPEHLEPVTNRENGERGYARNVNAALQLAKTYCRNGHPYDETNTRIVQRSNGKRERVCRICARDAERRYRGK